MVINVFISADSKKRKPFVDCIKNICDNSNGRYKGRFLPDKVGELREEDRLKRMFECLGDSHLIFMDITPIEYAAEGVDKYWLTNQGVLIEYGAIMGLVYLRDSLKLFCESSVKRNRLHAYFLKTVDKYSETNVDDINDPKSLRNIVIEIIKEFEKRLDGEYLVQKKDSSAYKDVLKSMLRDKK